MIVYKDSNEIQPPEKPNKVRTDVVFLVFSSPFLPFFFLNVLLIGNGIKGAAIILSIIIIIIFCYAYYPKNFYFFPHIVGKTFIILKISRRFDSEREIFRNEVAYPPKQLTF